MHQIQIEPHELPEIELKMSGSKVTDLPKLVMNEEVGAAFQVLIRFLAEEVAKQVTEKLGSIAAPVASPQVQVFSEIEEAPQVKAPQVEAAPVELTPTDQPNPTDLLVKVPFSTIDPATGKRVLSPEARKRISDAQKLKWKDRPRTHSLEARAKISKAQKTRWAIRGSSSTSREPTTSEADRPVPHGEHVGDVQSEPATVKAATLAVKEGYSGDPFYISEDGHYIGDDGFVVPKDCTEFLDRFPKYIENWVRKRLNGQGIEEDIEDWRQELIIHMKYLPATSKHRVAGKTDVFQVFDPFSQYGSSERRWRNYVNNCLKNKFNTIHGKNTKNPVCRNGNLSFSADDNHLSGHKGSGISTDEYIYGQSEFLSNATLREEKNRNDLFFATRFTRYVYETDPEVFPILEAVYVAGSSTDTVKEFCKTCKKLATTVEVTNGVHVGHEIGLSQKEFNRARNRLKALAVLFMQKDSSTKGEVNEPESIESI